MVLPLESNEMRTKLKRRILQKACGSFLWVSLVISELEQAYSAGFVENILNEVPADMNRLYERMLGRLPKDPRVAKLSKTILTWAVLSLRSLTILEMQYLVSLALDDTIFGLDKSYMSICGQLVRVDNSSRIKLIHQTTRTFLLQQRSHPEFVVNAVEGHSKLAKVCLEFLTGNDFKAARNQRMRNSPLKAGLRHDIANYTCTYFSDHLQRGSSEGAIEWGLLCKFFDTSVLSWIEHLASIGKTRHISRSAYNLQFYISRHIKHLPSISPQRAYIESWIIDLIRVSVKFRRILSTMPSSIFTLIPAMCPAESVVRKLHNDRFHGIAVVGKLQDKWDDYLVHMDYRPHQPTAVAYGNHALAVALSNGAIFLYHWDSIEMKFYMNHKERISLLTTSECGNWIASGGLQEVRVWNTRTGSLERIFPTKSRALTVLFDHDGASLTIATQGNKAVTWSLTDGTEQHEWQWIESIRRDSDWIAPYQPPNRALFSPDYTALVISYRGFHTYLFNMENESFVGCYHREKKSLAKSRRVSYWVDALAFNPNPEISVLIISYADGEIVVYDLWSTEIRFRLQDVFAHHLACSSDGRYLVATSSQGVIKIFRFKSTDGSKMSLNYRIDDNESVIRGVAVSREGFRLANIHGNCCSVWEPPLPDPGTQEENGQNQLSQVTTIDLKRSARLNQSLLSEITAMCCHSDGEIVFYGRRDGSVLYMDTENAKFSNILYNHTRDVTVISISYLRRYSLLVSVDEASQILVHKIKTLEFNCETIDMKTSVSLRQNTMEALKSFLVKEDCTRFLTQRLTFAQIWTGQGKLVGSALQLGDTEEQLREEGVTMMNHPFRADCFLCIKHEEVFVYSWLDGSEIYHIMIEAKGPALVISPCHEPFTGETSDESKETSSLDSHQKAEQHYVVNLCKVENVAPPSRRKTSALKIWKAKQTSAFDFRPLSVDTTTMSELESSIAQIITINGQLLLYIDVDFWICSVDLARMAEGSACMFRRHFFLLSEWRRSNGKFLIKYIPAKHEFAIARQSDALIIKRGFDYSQSWTPTDSLTTPIKRRGTDDTNDLAEIE